MRRRAFLASLPGILAGVLLGPLPVLASSPDEAKRRDDKKKQPPPPPPPPDPPGQPRGGDRRAPVDADDVNLTPDGKNYRAPWNKKR